MIARLTIHLPRQPTKTFLARQPGSYSIGRDPSCDLVLEDSRVSRRHARLAAEEEGWTLEDLGSKNGLSRDGEAFTETTLDRPCWISFGGLMGRFEPLNPDSPWSRERSRRWQSSLTAHQTLGQAGQDAETLVRRLVDSVLDITRAERGFVLLSGAGSELEIIGSSSADPDMPLARSFEGSLSTVQRVLDDGRPVVESDVVGDAGLAAQPSIVKGGIRGLVCLPLEAADERIGVLYADTSKPGASFDELDLEIVEALASHAALALWVAGVNRELKGLRGSLPTAFAPPAEGSDAVSQGSGDPGTDA